MKKYKVSLAGIVFSVIILFAIYFVFVPTIEFFIGFAMGGFIKLFIGNIIVKGFKMLNIDFNVNVIPYITGMAACLSSFFVAPKLGGKKKED